MTVKDVAEVLSFLEVVQRITERNIANSKPGLYREAMENQLERLNNLIKRLEDTRI